ncbi:hypothetical protein DRN72_04425 [Methanosarcinales archaeon]|nr:MAG: hypothetical protein DRN72_04425 [Methanosarcinales archaeon]
MINIDRIRKLWYLMAYNIEHTPNHNTDINQSVEILKTVDRIKPILSGVKIPDTSDYPAFTFFTGLPAKLPVKPTNVNDESSNITIKIEPQSIIINLDGETLARAVTEYQAREKWGEYTVNTG